MLNKYKNYFISIGIFLGLLGILFLATITPNIIKKEKKNPAERSINNEVIRFNLLDPEMAPRSIHNQVMYGYRIILYTNKILPQYVDSHLACANCHPSGGNTLGGKRGGISLLGVNRTYPRYANRNGKKIDIEDRINNCFERSLNGKPLPRNSKEMNAIVTYLEWIASEVPYRKDYPWLGLEPLKTDHIPDSNNGAKIYQRNCSLCHMKNGEGSVNYPPVWGPHAFNDGAGLSTLPMLSSFIFYNMPYNDPFLTEEQALDVSAFLIEQRRPTFIKP